MRSIIEIKKELFDQISPENQALVLLHELMHHTPFGQHVVISPIIKNLSILLPLKNLQDQGHLGLLSDQEFDASEQLEKLMSKLEGQTKRSVLRNGGGLVEGLDSKDGTNFVDLGSSLIVRGGQATANKLVNSHVDMNECGTFSQNEFSGSDIEFQCNQYAQKILSNRFVQSDLEVKATFFYGGDFVGNTFSYTHLLNSFVELQSKGSQDIKNNHFDTINICGDILLGGSNNTMMEVHEHVGQCGGYVANFRGNRSYLKGVDLSLGAGMLSLGNGDTVIELKELSPGILMLGDLVTLDHDSFGERYESCNTTIPAHAIIENQTIPCGEIHPGGQ